MDPDPIHYRSNREPLAPPGGIECFERDMTVTVSADVTLDTLSRKLEEFGQWLPIDGAVESTIGELVEKNSTGPLRLGYGAWRDLLLGCQFRNGLGELISAGGRTVKNVAGYDLTKFTVGQRGIFGRVVTVTSRTYRRPAGAILAEFAPEPERLRRMIPTAMRPQWAVLTAGSLYCGYQGDEATLDFYAASLAGARKVTRRSLNEDIAHRRQLWSVEGGHWFRAAVPPTNVMDFVKRAGLRAWTADAAFGIVIGPAECEGTADDHAAQEKIHAAAKEAGGSAFFEHSGSHVVHYPRAIEEKLLEALKDALDPDRQLDPL
jgi:FAD/FMN-containing dehydrogenase